MGLKIGDVYSFRYYEGHDKFMPYHCFDAQLVVKESDYRGIYLEDTFWCGCDNRIFTPEEAEKQGVLTLKFNLKDVEPLRGSPDYYDDSDLFNFDTQHHCYKKMMLRKGAKRSKAKMAAVINRKIDEQIYKMNLAKREIERLREKQIIVEYIGIDGVYI